MAYTNAWSHTIPSGSDQAKTIDNHIRQVRLDLEERLLTFFEDLDADPLVPLGSASGEGKVFIPAFHFVGGSETFNHRADYEDIYGSYMKMYTGTNPDQYVHSLPSVIRVGKQIKLLEIMGDKNDAPGFGVTLYSRPWAVGGALSNATILADAATTSASLTIAQSEDLTVDIEEDTLYWLAIMPFVGVDNRSANIVGVAITYGDPE